MDQELLELVRPILDPDIGVSVVDMGLIYDMKRVSEDRAWVLMTFTTPACPWGPQLMNEIGDAIVHGVDKIKEVEIEITWTPQWSLEMMSLEARLEAGFDL
jgi:metal-sulfur cluster biosynthetic enzyme